jgi:cytochrome c553
VRVPGSSVTFRDAELNDLYFAPDWRPCSHAPMPAIVARGRAPEVYACGYCHSPSGQGRPENASLAGLPAAYIVQQLADFRSGARRSAWRGPYRPSDLMIAVAAEATDEEVAAAASYFAAQTLGRRVRVIERAIVPRMAVVGWVYAAGPRATEEPLGERLLEIAPDPARHEHRDDALRYVAYAPPGSIARGRTIARSGGGATVACVSCHGASLRGVGLVPPLAGRSPTYLLRQLLAFQSGARAGPTGLPMQPVVAGLAITQMIDVAAYLGSLPP